MNAQEWLGLSGKAALVTGGSGGIGLAIVRRFLDLGLTVECLDTSHGELSPETAPGRLHLHTGDIRDRAGLEAVRDAILKAGRSLDILVLNAGINIRKPMLEFSDEEAERILGVNLLGTIKCLQVFSPMLFGRNEPRIVVTSSAIVEHGMVLRSVYAASKGGLSALVRSASLELGPKGVAINAFAPGIIRTPLTDRYMKEHPEVVEGAQKNTPLGRVGTPEEAADLAVFLASSASRFITGQTFLVDGGLSSGNNWW